MILEGRRLKMLKKILSCILNPKFFNKAPIAMKLAPNAIAGLSNFFEQTAPLIKYFKFIINRLKIDGRHLDYLKDHLLYQQ